MVSTVSRRSERLQLTLRVCGRVQEAEPQPESKLLVPRPVLLPAVDDWGRSRSWSRRAWGVAVDTDYSAEGLRRPGEPALSLDTAVGNSVLLRSVSSTGRH